MAGDTNGSGEASVAAIALTVAASARVEAARPRRLRLTVPRVVDYVIVAVFIYFVF